MALAKYFLVLLLATAALAQFEDKLSIDEFEIQQGPFIIVTDDQTTGGSFDDSVEDDGSNEIIGGERDILYVIENVNEANQVFSCGVSSGQFSEAAPPTNVQGDLGFVDLQWDGIDDSGASLDPSGLGGIDLTSNLANQFYARGSADFDFDTEVRVYSGSATDYCTGTFTVPGGTEDADFFINYTEFSDIGAGCDFTNVGAIQLLIDIRANLDLNLEFLRTFGPVPVSPTPTTTPTSTPSPDPSATRTPSTTPSATPTPSPIIEDDECYCVCPAFRCELFRSDDEDGGIYGYRSISDEYWNWYGFPTSVIYDFYSSLA